MLNWGIRLSLSRIFRLTHSLQTGSSKVIRPSTNYAAKQTRDSKNAGCSNKRLLFQLSIIIHSECPSFRKIIQQSKIAQCTKTSGIHVYISRPFGNPEFEKKMRFVGRREIILKCIGNKYIMRVKGKDKSNLGQALRLPGC